MSGGDDRGEAKRQERLLKQREQQRAEVERAKERIAKETAVSVSKVDDRFTVQTEDFATALAKDTVGLVSLKEFQARERELEARRAAEYAGGQDRAQGDGALDKKRAGGRKVVQKKTLSFSLDDEEEVGGDGGGTDAATAATEEQQPAVKRFKVGKDPHIDTSFLPDRERDLEEQRERERLAAEWRERQEQMKKEEFEVVFSYWDGSGHRSSVKCRKGETIATFLERARGQFAEIKNVSVESLMYIKEDLIIPHYYTFYDFIVNKARGKSGPLFHFDVHDDVRLVADSRIERDESHAGKVVERRWYERNKHIFPASRWEVYDPEKDYGKYTIGDNSNTV